MAKVIKIEGKLYFKGDENNEFFDMTTEMKTGHSYSRYDLDEDDSEMVTGEEAISVFEFLFKGEVDKICQLIYEQFGQSGIYTYANKKGITDWRHCSQCDCAVPVFKNDCLVCGQNLEGKVHITEEHDENHDLSLIAFPNGKTFEFKAKRNIDPNFPGFSIYVNGQLITIVEYDALQESLRTIAYKQDKDEPDTIIDFFKKE
mgnify:CR=1